MRDTDIAIVGMSCFLPGANNINDFWENLIKGVDSITDVPEEKIDSVYFKNNSNKIDHFYCHKGGFTPPITIDPGKLNIPAHLVNQLDPVHLLVLKLVYQALEDASVFEKNISLKNCSIIIGKGEYVSSNNLKLIDIVHTSEQIALALKNVLPDISDEDIENVKEAFQKDKDTSESTLSFKNTSKTIATVLATQLETDGAAYIVDASEVSSLLAVEQSIQELLLNKTDIAIAGGIHFSQNSTYWSVFSQAGLLSSKQQIKPFNEDADGLLLGEGAGFIILKKLSQAIADNDRIYAVIKGVGINSNAENKSDGQKKAIQKAWQTAGIKSSDLGYIEANGSAIKEEDITELDTLSQLFKDQKTLIGTVKSNIGHTLSNSGMASIIKTALSLYNRKIPATLHCDKPNDALKNSTITPVIETTDWDEKQYPLNAGINTFGFEGISAHAVLQAFDKADKHQSLPTFEEEAVAISTSSKEALLEALDKRDFSVFDPNGNYRLVLFNPTTDRIEKAKKLIAKDKSWKGRQDIWFSNNPLLRNDGKVAFLFPGFDPASNPEVESIAKYFGYTIPEETAKENLLLSHSFKQYHGGEIIDGSLKKLGVIPDMNAGHSLGEWFAAKAGGLFPTESVERLLKSMDPEKYKMDDVYFIAVGVGTERINPILEKIPDLYLSNDNCPSQILLCGTETARDQLIQILKSEQIFYQVLNFQSGFHSPFLKNKLHLVDEALEHITIQKNNIPVWSATTLELYPHNLKAFKELTIKHLTQAVLFRELIEKLYKKENARVFIQIGSGSLIGFVDDILKNQEYAAISAYIQTRSTLEQLRRVLALLYIEGKEINLSFLGLKENINSSQNEIHLSENSALVKDFPLLQELSKKYSNHSLNSDSLDSLFIKSNHPVVQAMNENMKELILMQKEFSEIVEKKKTFSNSNFKYTTTSDNNYIQPKTEIYPQQPIVLDDNLLTIKTGNSFEEDLYVDIKDHPYLIDHSLIRQPKHWTNLEDINPVIPMTMTFELLIEAAHKQDLNKKVLRLGPVSVFQWMKVFTPFHQVIEGTWKTEDKISLKIKNFANGEVTLGDSFPIPDPAYLKEIDLGENIVSPPTPEIIYEDHMFHGPGYQGILEVKNVTKKGLRGIIKKSFGKGSLLDNIGQLYGLYLQLTLGEDSSVSFPVKIEEMNFYQDVDDQQGIFECVCIQTSLTPQLATADIIIKRDGKIWCIIKGWKNQIFEEFDKKLWDLTMHPPEYILAENLAPNIYFFNNVYNKAINWEFLMQIYLNQEEKRHYDSLMLNKKKDYLISRISLKDSARKYIEHLSGKKYYPIEFNIQYDKNGKPSIHGVPETNNMEISLAHKGSNSVTIVSDKPVGIDIETIEKRDSGFMDLTFTTSELELLKNRDSAEWCTRFWTAKEAYGKMLGVGLKGNPKQYEIKFVEGEKLTINNTIINTIKYNNFIIGWTL